MKPIILTSREISLQAQHLVDVIKTFAEKYYSPGMSEGWDKSANKRYRKYLELTTPESPLYRRYLDDHEGRARVISGFVWRVLVYEVFECFHWAGKKTGRNFRQLREWVRPVEGDGLNDEQYQKLRCGFNAWSTANLQLIRETIDRLSDVEQDLLADYKEQRVKYVAKNILATIGYGYGVGRSRDIQKDLVEIINTAWRLDIVLTQDFREFSWIWGTQPLLTELRAEFNPLTDQDWANGRLDYKEGGSCYVRLVCSPALVKTIDEQNHFLDDASRDVLLKRLVSLSSSNYPNENGVGAGLKPTVENSYNNPRPIARSPLGRPIGPLKFARSSDFLPIQEDKSEDLEDAEDGILLPPPPPVRVRSPGPERSEPFRSAPAAGESGLDRRRRPKPIDVPLPSSRRHSFGQWFAGATTPQSRDRPASATARWFGARTPMSGSRRGSATKKDSPSPKSQSRPGSAKKTSESPLKSIFTHKPGTDFKGPDPSQE
ncbi:hypothetical protein V8F20_008199 [Naviculisporaceae sp. PSN 640]